MAWFEDLAPCSYSGEQPARHLRAVGWLERGHPFPTGQVDRGVYARLVEFAKNPWQPVIAAGVHACDLCLYESEVKGVANLFVPAEDFLYVCPGLISHYMNAHAYAPPPEFCRAVLDCPPMKSMQYLRSVLACGGRLLTDSKAMG